MNFDLGTALNSLVGLLVGSGIVAIWLRYKVGELASVREEIRALKEQRIKALEENVSAISESLKSMDQSGCRVGLQVLARVENLIGWMKKVDQKLGQIADETAAQREQIRSNDRWLANLDKALADHTRDREVHHNG